MPGGLALGRLLVGGIALGLAVAFGTWAYALSRMPAGRLAVTTYLVPPLTIVLAWPVLGETPDRFFGSAVHNLRAGPVQPPAGP